MQHKLLAEEDETADHTDNQPLVRRNVHSPLASTSRVSHVAQTTSSTRPDKQKTPKAPHQPSPVLFSASSEEYSPQHARRNEHTPLSSTSRVGHVAQTTSSTRTGKQKAPKAPQKPSAVLFSASSEESESSWHGNDSSVDMVPDTSQDSDGAETSAELMDTEWEDLRHPPPSDRTKASKPAGKLVCQDTQSHTSTVCLHTAKGSQA